MQTGKRLVTFEREGGTYDVEFSPDGTLIAAGYGSYIFSRKGLITFNRSAVRDEYALIEAAVEAGAEDVKEEGDMFEVVTDVAEFEAVKEAIAGLGITPDMAEITMIPSNTVPLQGKHADVMLKLMDFLEDHNDVQHVYSNFDVPDEVLAAAGA